MNHRIHIFGPSGSGCSTLGRALATHIATQHFDADDFYFQPSDPPFQTRRPVEDRYRLMQDVFVPRSDWVLSGSVDSWDGVVRDRFTHVFRLELDKDIRHARLVNRDQRRHGAAVQPGGAMYQQSQDFLKWADGYEAGDRPGRSLARHKTWEQTLNCPVHVLNSEQPLAMMVSEVLMHLDRDG
ncbi:hypothetical protein [Aestuariibius sp. HNIBRBA575]|uniref:hypothetical protein n=1 Tax=Aestuariibius sp. HNIBRBA575 TaxID=3233343 RepID=UPI0034A12D05